jgi:tRNA(Ile)-lysidine synthase TilS/MesJ
MANKEISSGEKLFKKTCKKVGQTIREHNLISDNDRLLVGLSGGKDSMILLESLVALRKSFPFNYEIFVAHVVPLNTGYKVDMNYLSAFCKKLGLDFMVKEIEPDFSRKEKSVCFVCSWFRRKALFDLGKELNCNKLVFGHHRDDALHTFMMNMIYHASISSMPYSLKMFEGRLDLIRPLLNLWEKDLNLLAEKKNYESVQKSCPYDEKTKRYYVSDLIKSIEEQYPKAKINMFHSLDNIYRDYLPGVKKKSN